MKYVLAALTFVIGFILFVLIHVFMNLNMGGFLSNLMMGIIFVSTGFVFMRFDKTKSKVKVKFSKAEEKAFHKIFNLSYLETNKIELVLIKETNEGYSIYIKMNDFLKIVEDDLVQNLQPHFQSHIIFKLYKYQGDEEASEINGFVISSN